MSENPETKSGAWIIVLAVAMLLFIGGSAWYNVDSTSRFKECMTNFVQTVNERGPYNAQLSDIRKRKDKVHADLYTQILNPDANARAAALVTAQKQFSDLEKEQTEVESQLNAKPLPTAADCR